MIIANLRNIYPEQLLEMIETGDQFFDAIFASVQDWDDLDIVNFSIGDTAIGSLSGEEIREAMRRAGKL